MPIFKPIWERPTPAFLPRIGPTYPPKFETLPTTWTKWASTLRILNDTDDPEAAKMLRRMSRCGVRKACGSAACHRCNRAFRLQLYRETLRVLPDDYEVLRVSLIPRSFRVEVGRLQHHDLTRWAKSRHQGIARALPADALFIGGIDISLNTLENRDPHWSLHVYGFVLLPPGWGVGKKRSRARLRARIERHCPPIPVDDRVAGEVPLTLGPRSRADFKDNLLYAHKAEFYHRSRYAYTKTVSGKPSTNAVSQSLDNRHHAEVAIYVNRFPLGQRLLLVGFRRRGGFADFTLYRERDFQSSRDVGPVRREGHGGEVEGDEATV